MRPKIVQNSTKNIKYLQVLSDETKRRQYDLYGPMENQGSSSGGHGRGRHGFYDYDPTHGFESDMTAEVRFLKFLLNFLA